MDVLNQTGLQTQISYIKAYVNNAIENQEIDMADYEKPESTSAIATTDTVIEAIGKLEKALDNKQAAGSYLTTSGTAADSDKLGGTVASDYALKTDLPTVPTDVSDFTNDAGYLTSTDLTGYATETYVDTAVSDLVNSAPATLDTLGELAAALGEDLNLSTTVAAQIGSKVSADSANYIKGASVSGKTLTLTKGDDTTVTFTETGIQYSDATTSASGLMSAADKTKLDDLEEYTESEITALWNVYFGVQVTVTINQSAHQTIHVTVNEVDHTETFTATAGAAYIITVTPDAGYTAGTVTNSTGTFTNDTTISATAPTLNTYTLTLAATEDQTITLTYTEPDEEAVTVTSTSTAQEITVYYGTTWTASATTSVIGYDAGTLTPGTSGTVTGDVTVSASEITIQTFTLTLAATENQTITLTYTEPNESAQTLTSTSTAQNVTVDYGTTWIASVEADTGYTAGTLSAASGTVTSATTVSATAATAVEPEPDPE